MKVIDRSEFRDEEGNISLQDRIRATLQHGFDWYAEMQAQEFTSEVLGKSLGNEHTLLRNIFLPAPEVTVAMTLLSPQGVRVIVPSLIRGVFRAAGEKWMKFDRSRRFKPSKPNPQERTLQLALAVHRHIKEQGYELPEVEAVLLFTNPRTHIDQNKPRVRIVQADAIEHFASNLLRLPPIMDQDDIRALAEALMNPRSPGQEPGAEVSNEVSFEAPSEPALEVAPEAVLEAVREAAPEAVPDVAPRRIEDLQPVYPVEPVARESPNLIFNRFERLGLSRRQWILLGVMIFFEIVILMIMVVIVIANTIYI